MPRPTPTTVNVQSIYKLGILSYKVRSTRNTLDPRVGSYLTEQEINTLIADGVTVNIK